MPRKQRSRPAEIREKGTEENITQPHLAGEELIKSLRGSCKGEDSLVDGLHKERQEKSFAERRWENRTKSQKLMANS